MLEEAGAPYSLRAMVRAMYADQPTDMDFHGRRATSVRILSGIRQGCPLSGTIFAICLEPFVRWCLARPVFQASRLFAYADDVAIVMRRLAEQLGPLTEALLDWEAVTGLTLKPSKCIVLLVSPPPWGHIGSFVQFVQSVRRCLYVYTYMQICMCTQTHTCIHEYVCMWVGR